jgi:hypothetical protein
MALFGIESDGLTVYQHGLVRSEGAVMDIKLALLFLVVSAMITLSNLDDENVERIKQQLLRWQWRG